MKKLFICSLFVYLTLFVCISTSSAEKYSYKQAQKLISDIAEDGVSVFSDATEGETYEGHCGAVLVWQTDYNQGHLALHDNSSSSIYIWQRINLHNVINNLNSLCSILCDYIDFSKGGYIELFIIDNADSYNIIFDIVYSPNLEILKQWNPYNFEAYYDDIELFKDAAVSMLNQYDKVDEVISQDSDKEIVLYNGNGIKVYLTRNYKIRELFTEGEFVIDFECIIENNSYHDVTIYVPDSSMNDWESGSSPCYGDSGGFDFKARKNKKAKGVICFSLKEANVKTYADIEKLEFILGIYFDERSHYSNQPNLSKDICLEFIDDVIYYNK